MLSSFQKPKPNISLSESKAIKTLKTDSSISILKADKGNCTVIVDSNDYNFKMFELLSDNETYSEIKNDPTKKIERSMNSKLLELKRNGKIEETEYFTLRSTDGIIPRLYGLVKIHKDS